MVKRRLDCRVCRSLSLKTVLNFGTTPLANSYLEHPDQEETFYPLQVNQCTECGNVQLAHIVDPEILFSTYFYASSVSAGLVKHFTEFAQKMGKQHFVIDIGGNDGILLEPFQTLGSKVLNIDPASNIPCDVPVIHEFFNIKVAQRVVREMGRADLVTATNVFAHIDNLDEVVNGVKLLLTDRGQFVVEVSDLEQMMLKGTFDQIYHEHVNYWSETALRKFFELRNMDVVKVEKIPIQGGSLRVYARVSK